MTRYEPCFDAEKHIYHDPAGMRLEGVTDILQGELGGFDGFPAAAAKRGQDVHAAIQAHNEGRLKAEEVLLETWGYLECFLAAQKQLKIEIVQSEVMRYHPRYLYAGRLDALVKVDGVMGILDYKTGQPNKRDKWQLAAYLELVKAENKGIQGRWNLYLRPEPAGYKLVKYEDKSDFSQFLALFAAYQIKKNNGYIKERRDL